jgi:hypothetical protein
MPSRPRHPPMTASVVPRTDAVSLWPVEQLGWGLVLRLAVDTRQTVDKVLNPTVFDRDGFLVSTSTARRPFAEQEAAAVQFSP